MDVTDTVLAAVTGGVTLLCCACVLISALCARKYVVLRQTTYTPVHRERLSTEEELIP
jgi:hypothetical protein